MNDRPRTYDRNEAHLTGTVERLDTIETRTGNPMIRLALRCGRERFTIVAFGDLALGVMFRPGDRAEVNGRIEVRRWSAPDGAERTGVQIVASSIHPEPKTRQRTAQAQIGGILKSGRDGNLDGRQRRLPGTGDGGAFNRAHRPGVMDYRGGPF